MAYVPPHKRLSSAHVAPRPTPELFKTKLSLRSDQRNNSGTKTILNADHAIYRCLAVPLQEDGQIPLSVHFVPISSESVEWKYEYKPLILVDDRAQLECSDNDTNDCRLKRPWVSVAEKAHLDLLSAFQNVKDETANASLGKIKAGVAVRFGKVLFHGSYSHSVDQLKDCTISEFLLNNVKKIFNTDVPVSYVEHIKNKVVPEIGIEFEGKKEQYIVKLADNDRVDSFIACKCRLQEGEEKLELYKMESVPLRYLMVDVSCLDSRVDLRLALYTERAITALTDEEKQTIGDIISSAILDSNVKGGLRWPLGMTNSRARYSVIQTWHTETEVYSNSSMRLKVKEADRYDFLSSTGSVTREVFLKLTGTGRILMEESDAKAVSALLEDTLKMIWENFLKWDGGSRSSSVSYSDS